MPETLPRQPDRQALIDARWDRIEAVTLAAAKLRRDACASSDVLGAFADELSAALLDDLSAGWPDNPARRAPDAAGPARWKPIDLPLEDLARIARDGGAEAATVAEVCRAAFELSEDPSAEYSAAIEQMHSAIVDRVMANRA